MADQRNGGIGWTDETWNPIRGCSRASEECLMCYAQYVAFRFSGPGQPYDGLAKMTSSGANWTGVVRFIEEHLLDPLRWKRPRRVFVNSMSDLFHESLPKPIIDLIVAVMALADRHTFQCLTKRADRMRAYLTDPELPGRLAAADALVRAAAVAAGVKLPATTLWRWPLPNVWWGISAGNQKWLNARIRDFLACRPHAAVLWLSCEPLIGPISFESWAYDRHPSSGDVSFGNMLNGFRGNKGGGYESGIRIDWVVAGGEAVSSSVKPRQIARPMHPDWPLQIRAQCQKAGAAFNFKQWGDWQQIVYRDTNTGQTYLKISLAKDDPNERVVPNQLYQTRDVNMVRVGKKAAGRLLDGRVHDDYPAAQSAA